MNFTRDNNGRPTSFQGMADYVHHLNYKWWIDPKTGCGITRNRGQMRMLMISELSEAMEGERKSLMDDKLPTRPMPEVELADAVIRALDYGGGFGYKIIDLRPVKITTIFNTFTAANDKGEMLEQLCKSVIGIGMVKDVGVMLSAFIRECEMYCEFFGYDLWGAVFDKLEYNKTREDHTLEARLRATGKKW